MKILSTLKNKIDRRTRLYKTIKEELEFIYPSIREINEKKFIISRVPAIDSNKILKGINQDGFGTKEHLLSCFKYCAVIKNNETIRLDTEEKINKYTDFKELIFLKKELYYYNMSIQAQKNTKTILEVIKNMLLKKQKGI